MKKIFILLFILITPFTNVSVVLERTRLVFPADQSTILLQIVNQSEQSTLIQSWTDEGNIASTPETTTAPFLVIPPMAKISTNGGLQLKLQQLDNSLPQDRESIFYLNVLDIPPKPDKKENVNTLQLALQTRIKIFYRPNQLTLTTRDIFKQIEITQSAQYLEINNPSAYFFTISKIYIDDKEAQPLINAIMVAPFSKQKIQYQGQVNPHQIMTLVYIDDDGNYQQDEKMMKK
ncbi:molecular chaperone [Proteus vulgaris]|uniref:fimbrial biogenesis chaperone n=1 Tax=Proteus vulgaris TaxID=585 RepID=UPI0018CFB5D2|nr:molecular chaperone [Proteus vulgaris]QPN88767.1 molecular chaperone [Proteus vulgaris]